MARGRPRDPDITQKVIEARALIEGGSTLRAAAAKVGVHRDTLRYRLTEPQPEQVSLPDIPDPDEVPVFVRDYTDRAKHTIYPIGDLHIGSPQHAGKALASWLDYLDQTDGVSMLNTGDNTNCALKTSVSDIHAERLTVRDARERQTKLFRPLAEQGKIDAIIDGNHEMRVYNATGDSPNAAVADALGINYTMAACVVRYLVGDQSYDLYLRHGTGGGGKLGAQVNRLHDPDKIIDADIYVSGHTHTQHASVTDTFRITGTRKRPKVERRKQLFVCSGSFVGYEDYAASAGYVPSHIGAPRVFLDGRRKDAHASV
jgi:hypothetical protein